MSKVNKLSGGNSVYPADAPVILSGADFAIIRYAFEEILNKGLQPVYPPKFKFWKEEINDYIPESEVVEADLDTGKVLRLVDSDATFRADNLVQGFDGRLITEDLREAYLTLTTRIEIDANKGKTISLEEFKNRYNGSGESTAVKAK